MNPIAAVVICVVSPVLLVDLWPGYGRLACALGIHRWKIFYIKSPFMVQKCNRCKAFRSTMSSEVSGIYWVKGDLWSDKE